MRDTFLLEFGTRALALNVAKGEEIENLPRHVEVLTAATHAMIRILDFAQEDRGKAPLFDGDIADAMPGVQLVACLAAKCAQMLASEKKA